MVEVFKTNVTDPDYAQVLLDYMYEVFPLFRASFDLEDCDRILRIQWAEESGPLIELTEFLKFLGCLAEPLPDDESETGFWYTMLPEDILLLK